MVRKRVSKNRTCLPSLAVSGAFGACKMVEAVQRAFEGKSPKVDLKKAYIEEKRLPQES